MGDAISTGENNDELVDNLIDSGYIRSKTVEQVFRAVDRGDYFLSTHRENAYKDFAWKHGNLHLSAPCIYSEVMEELALKPGLSFLNLGSGTGYLNTMAGLLLTQSGINHGIEIHEDCVRYAYDRLDEFKQKSPALDEFDFCEPVFIQGNCLSVFPRRRYDRVYCGATCPEIHEALIKDFTKVGGILVMPFDGQLIKAKRIDETTWAHEFNMPVLFTNLIEPTTSESTCSLPNCDPLSLQELCRSKIRRALREIVRLEHTDLKTYKSISSNKSRTNRAERQFFIQIWYNGEESDVSHSDDDEETENSHWAIAMQIVRRYFERNTNEEAEEAEVEAVESDSDQDDNHDNNCLNDEGPSNTKEEIDSDIVLDEREGQSSDSISNTVEGKLQSEDQIFDNASEKFDDRPGSTIDLLTYSNMSEDEIEVDEESRNDDSRSAVSSSPLQQQSTSRQRKKKCRQSKKDSGIVDDSSCTGNDEASFNSDSDFSSGTPVKHKRPTPSTPRSSKCSDTEQCESCCKCSTTGNIDSADNHSTAHYINTNALSSYMKEKIHQLPLPYTLKLYINYNRSL